ncbi:MAG: hypothetical protein ABI382_12385 [Nakamurella sp.]
MTWTRRTFSVRRILSAGIAALAGALLLSGCTAGETSYPVSTTVTASPDRLAIETAIGSINRDAGKSVASQRAVLDRLAAPDQAAEQRACPIATTTLAFDPAYAGLKALAGSAYLLPTYITVYTDGRMTGSDLATLHLWVIDGVARTSALCVS